MNTISRCYEKFVSTINTHNLFADVERFVILFSCGKDCSMMLDLFIRYCNDNGIDTPWTVFSAPYPKHMYYSKDGQPSRNFLEIQNYWKMRGIDIRFAVPEFDDFADDDRYGCKTCKFARKSVIDEYVNQFGNNTGILTGFTMNDALSYLNMLMLTCNYDVSSIPLLEEPLKSTTTKMLHKMSLRETLPNGKFMIRPVLPFSEREVVDYLKDAVVPSIDTPCRISKYKFKRHYSRALGVFDPYNVTYSGMEKFLETIGISLNNGGLPFDDVKFDNYFIDC